MKIDADIEGVRVIECIHPERILDDDRRIASNAQFQKNDPQPVMPSKKILIPFLSLIPPLVLHKGIVRPQIHGHRLATDRTAGHKL